MHKNATKCNKTQSKWCINKHGASKIIDTFETYQVPELLLETFGKVPFLPHHVVACYYPGHLCCHCDTRCFGGHRFDSCSHYTMQLLGCENHSCHNCGFVASGCCICSTCRWSSSLVFICVLSMCKSVCYIYDLCHYFWHYPAHLLDKVFSMKPLRESIDCPFIRDFHCWIFYDTPTLYIWAERFVVLQGASFDFLCGCWPLVSRIEIAYGRFCEFVPASNCLPA
jgi:hypothetical protein